MNCPSCNEPIAEADFDVKIDNDSPPEHQIRVSLECVECGAEYFNLMSLANFVAND